MKKWLAGYLTALLLTALTLPVMAAEDIDARLHRAQERINHLSNSGEISPREQQRLERELNSIREKKQDLQRRMDHLDNDIDQARRHRRELIPGVPVPPLR